jgi:hypothetical protein
MATTTMKKTTTTTTTRPPGAVGQRQTRRASHRHAVDLADVRLEVVALRALVLAVRTRERRLARVDALVHADLGHVRRLVLAEAARKGSLARVDALVLHDVRLPRGAVLARRAPKGLVARVGALVPRDVRRVRRAVRAVAAPKGLLAGVRLLVLHQLRAVLRHELAEATVEVLDEGGHRGHRRRAVHDHCAPTQHARLNRAAPAMHGPRGHTPFEPSPPSTWPLSATSTGASAMTTASSGAANAGASASPSGLTSGGASVSVASVTTSLGCGSSLGNSASVQHTTSDVSAARRVREHCHGATRTFTASLRHEPADMARTFLPPRRSRPGAHSHAGAPANLTLIVNVHGARACFLARACAAACCRRRRGVSLRVCVAPCCGLCRGPAWPSVCQRVFVTYCVFLRGVLRPDVVECGRVAGCGRLWSAVVGCGRVCCRPIEAVHFTGTATGEGDRSTAAWWLGLASALLDAFGCAFGCRFASLGTFVRPTMCATSTSKIVSPCRLQPQRAGQ